MIAAWLLVAFRPNPSGAEMYAKMIKRLASVNSISGIEKVSLGTETDEINFVLARPDKFRLESKRSQTFGVGSQIFIYNTANREVFTQSLQPGEKSYPVPGLESLFTDDAPFYTIHDSAASILIGDKKVWALQASLAKNPTVSMTLLVDSVTFLPAGMKSTTPAGPVTVTIDAIHLNPLVTKSTFHWSTPPGSHEVPANPSAEKLLAVGSLAPDFELKTDDGRVIKLSEVVSAHKATVISFWFYGCMACRAEMPHLVATYNSLTGQGLEILGINVSDPVYRIQSFRAEFHIRYPLLAKGGPVSDTYGVTGCPTTYVIGTDRKIVAAIVGGQDIEKLGRALQSLGFKL